MMKRLLMLAILVFAAGAPFSAVAQDPALPTPIVEEVMVKTSLMTFNDANLTGNYAVMHARMARIFRDRFGPEKIKDGFKAFAGQHIDAIVAKPIVRTAPAKIDSNGFLMLRGYFDTAPSRVSYELDFAVSEGEWKMINIDVRVRPVSMMSDAQGNNTVVRAGAVFMAR